MTQKKAVTRELQNRYQKAKKKEKIMILNEFTQLTGYNRCYASQILGKGKLNILKQNRDKETVLSKKAQNSFDYISR